MNKKEESLKDIMFAFASLAAATAQQLDPKLYQSHLRRIQKHMASAGETGTMYSMMMDKALSLIEALPREEPPKRH